MAWVEPSTPAGPFKLSFRRKGAKYRKTVAAKSKREAEGIARRVDENLSLAERGRLINSPWLRFPGGSMPPDALVSLESDRVFIPDQGQNVYRFGHDLLEDWSLLRLLEQRRENLPAYLHELGQPHGLLRAVRLLGCVLLERGGTAGDWAELLRAFEQVTHLARQAVLTAPFLSTQLEELLDKA